MSSKELRLTLRVRNNRLIAAREALGLSARQAAEKIAMSYQMLLDYEGLRISPLGARGTWRQSAQRIALFYGGSIEFYWPDAVMAVVEPVRTIEIDGMDVARLSAPAALHALPSEIDVEAELIGMQDRDHMRDLVSQLAAANPRVAEVVRRRFGLDGEDEETLGEISESIVNENGGVGVSIERTRSLQEEGLAWIRRRAFLPPQTPEEVAIQEAQNRRALEARETRKKGLAIMRIVRQLSCSHCGAGPGQDCKSAYGSYTAVHGPRRLAAELQLIDEQKRSVP